MQASLHVNDVQLEDLAVGFRRVLQTKPLESNLRKTAEITVETLFDLSCDLREEWKDLAFALGVGDAKNDRVDERNQTFREKCYNMLLLILASRWRLKRTSRIDLEIMRFASNIFGFVCKKIIRTSVNDL